MSMTFDYEEFLVEVWEDEAFLDSDCRPAELIQKLNNDVQDSDDHDSHPR